jgi:hypothetical protein
MNNPLQGKQAPRYLPHMEHGGVLCMGLSRIEPKHWLETDAAVGELHRFKLNLAAENRGRVYGETSEGREAAAELARLVESHLLNEQAANYLREGHGIRCVPGAFTVASACGDPLWRASLLIGDDLVVMVPGIHDQLSSRIEHCLPSTARCPDCSTPCAANRSRWRSTRIFPATFPLWKECWPHCSSLSLCYTHRLLNRGNLLCRLD